jgi:hypothetical protein
MACKSSVDAVDTVTTVDSIDSIVTINDYSEYSELMKFCNDTAVTIFDGEKSGEWKFSKYRRNSLTGLILLSNDSIVFINDTFFMDVKTEYQQFEFVDSLSVAVYINTSADNKITDYKYVFELNEASGKWLLIYAEKKETVNEKTIYTFTDKFPTKISMDGFSAHAFVFPVKNTFQYKYRKRNYLDSIEIQVSNMRANNVALFKKVFTIEHAEEILRDYPVRITTVTALNNIGYYLEQMSIAMPAVVILEAVIDEYANRTVGYRNLSDALRKLNLNIKAGKIYDQYLRLKEESF